MNTRERKAVAALYEAMQVVLMPTSDTMQAIRPAINAVLLSLIREDYDRELDDDVADLQAVVADIVVATAAERGEG